MQREQFHANWNYPTQIKFGIGRIRELDTLCTGLNIRRPLLITDPGIASLNFLQQIIDQFNKHQIPLSLFTDVKPNPVAANIEAGIHVFRNGGHDGVIAVGGGSALDSAKAINFMASQSRPLWDFVDEGDNYLRAQTDRLTPLIAVPTTSGTGAEVGRCSLIIDEQAHQKKFIFHPSLMPTMVLADPELTAGLPAHLTAATGMDTFTHNFEAFCAKGYHPMADGIALEGLRLINKWLPIAVQDGSHLEARAHLMSASIMGGSAFQKGLGAIHSLSHPVGAIYDAHHGLLNAIFLPYVLDYNRKALGERLQRLARYLNLPQHDSDAVLDWTRELLRKINIPLTLKAINVDEQHLDEIVAQAMIDPSTGGNPIALNKQDFAIILNNAIQGTLVD